MNTSYWEILDDTPDGGAEGRGAGRMGRCVGPGENDTPARTPDTNSGKPPTGNHWDSRRNATPIN